MADEILTENDGDEDFVIVEEPTGGEGATGDGTAPAGEDTGPSSPAGQQTDDDDEDGDDERLAANEEDTEDGLTPNQIKRKRKRELRKRAIEATQAELAELRAFKAASEPRLAALEKNMVGVNTLTVEGRLTQARQAFNEAEAVRKAAEEAGNVSDAMEAIRIRDAADADIKALEPALTFLRQQEKPAEQTPTPQPNAHPIAQHAANWAAQNPWYKDGGTDDASIVTRQTVANLQKEGRDPGTIEFWREVSARMKPFFSTDDADDKQAAPAEKQGRKAPPTGNQREHATPSTKQREVHLSRERIQAIKDAGKWDDPGERNKMVRAYLDYDKRHAASQ